MKISLRYNLFFNAFFHNSVINKRIKKNTPVSYITKNIAIAYCWKRQLILKNDENNSLIYISKYRFLIIFFIAKFKTKSARMNLKF